MNLFSKIKSSFKSTVEKVKDTFDHAKETLHDLFSPEEKTKKSFGAEVKEQYKEVEIKFGKKTAKILHSKDIEQNSKVDDLNKSQVKGKTETIKNKPLLDIAKAETKVYLKGYFDSYFMELKGSKKYDDLMNEIINKFDGNLSKAYTMVDKMENGDLISNSGTDPLLYEDPEAFREEMINRLLDVEKWVERNVR